MQSGLSRSIPGWPRNDNGQAPLLWPVVVAPLATIVASQPVISSTFSVVKEVFKIGDHFEIDVLMSIAEFIQMEAEGSGTSEGTVDGCMAVVKTSGKFGTVLVMAQTSGLGESSCSSSAAIVSSAKSPALQNLQATYEQEALNLNYWRQARYGLLDAKCKDSLVREQLQEVVEAKHAG